MATDLENTARLLVAGGKAFYHRAKCDSAAALGKYSRARESQAAAA